MKTRVHVSPCIALCVVGLFVSSTRVRRICLCSFVTIVQPACNNLCMAGRRQAEASEPEPAQFEDAPAELEVSENSALEVHHVAPDRGCVVDVRTSALLASYTSADRIAEVPILAVPCTTNVHVAHLVAYVDHARTRRDGRAVGVYRARAGARRHPSAVRRRVRCRFCVVIRGVHVGDQCPCVSAWLDQNGDRCSAPITSARVSKLP